MFSIPTSIPDSELASIFAIIPASSCPHFGRKNFVDFIISFSYKG